MLNENSAESSVDISRRLARSNKHYLGIMRNDSRWDTMNETIKKMTFNNNETFPTNGISSQAENGIEGWSSIHWTLIMTTKRAICSQQN